VLRRARALTRRPIWVKLSYAAAPLLLDQARICADEGADALTAINTLPALAIDIATQPLTAGRSFVGGLSGPSLTPLAQWAVDLLHRQQPLPVIACGGVSSLRQLLSFVALGAAAVQVGSALLDDPQLCGRLDAELQAMLRDNQLSDFSQLAEVLCLPSTS
jgi:dihydroorotate dehydrogenase (NAD+) catalytic subunit